MTRTTGARAHVLNSEALLALAQETLQRDNIPTAGVAHGPTPQMLFTVEEGPAIVNNEGVGAVAEDDLIAVYFTDGFQWFPIDLNLTEVIETTGTSETIDLAEGIRSFGSRLDGVESASHRAGRISLLMGRGGEKCRGSIVGAPSLAPARGGAVRPQPAPARGAPNAQLPGSNPPGNPAQRVDPRTRIS